jgi:hypothetical protein
MSVELYQSAVEHITKCYNTKFIIFPSTIVRSHNTFNPLNTGAGVIIHARRSIKNLLNNNSIYVLECDIPIYVTIDSIQNSIAVTELLKLFGIYPIGNSAIIFRNIIIKDKKRFIRELKTKQITDTVTGNNIITFKTKNDNNFVLQDESNSNYNIVDKVLSFTNCIILAENIKQTSIATELIDGSPVIYRIYIATAVQIQRYNDASVVKYFTNNSDNNNDITITCYDSIYTAIDNNNTSITKGHGTISFIGNMMSIS